MARRLLSLALAGLCFLAMQAAPMTWAATRTAHLFISDLHMNLDAPYSWLNSHLGTLVSFLGEVKGRQDVAELTILGDFVDDWVMPYEKSPDMTFESILATERNQEVIKALNALSPDIKLNYVTGNHDLLSFNQANLDVLRRHLPNINITSSKPGWGAYDLDGVVHAEHGHRYSIANSPDTWSWGAQDSQLPLGYFITRTVTKDQGPSAATAYPDLLAGLYKDALGLHFLPAAAQAGAGSLPGLSADTSLALSRTWWETLLMDTLDSIIKYFPGLVEDATKMLYAGLAIANGLTPSSVYAMYGLDNFGSNPTYLDVEQNYRDVIAKWSDRQAMVDPATAIAADLGYLNFAAEDLMADHPGMSYAPKIVLFGHTHDMLFRQYDDGAIYVNTGAWIDAKPCSYVEIDVINGQGRTNYEVELWQYAREDGTIDPRSMGKGSVSAAH